MIGVALKGLAARKVRALLTAFAIVIGVSMVSGTFILTDTMQKSFDGLFRRPTRTPGRSSPRRSTSRARPAVTGSRFRRPCWTRSATPRGRGSQRPGLTAGVRRRRHHRPDGSNAARESIGGGIDPANANLSPLKLKTGEWPVGSQQVVIDAGTAAKQQYEVGDDVVISTFGVKHTFRMSGHRVVRWPRLARAGEHRGLGHRDRSDAAGPRGPVRLDRDRGQEGNVDAELVQAVKPLLPSNLQVKDGEARPRRRPKRSTARWT